MKSLKIIGSLISIILLILLTQFTTNYWAIIITGIIILIGSTILITQTNQNFLKSEIWIVIPSLVFFISAILTIYNNKEQSTIILILGWTLWATKLTRDITAKIIKKEKIIRNY